MNRKKLLGLVFAFAAASASALVQPMRINFQGKLLNPTTNNPQTGPATLIFKLYNVPTGGAALYTETQSNVPLTNGVFSVQIGSLTAISRDLFLGASVYLGVTVSGDTEMLPRQNLAMSAYAYTASQLSDLTEVRLIAGPTYSTFTSAGNFTVPAGVSGSSGSFTSGVTAGSGTFTQTGGALYSLETSSGIVMDAGTLSINGGGGIDAGGTGILTSTLTFQSIAQPHVSAAGTGSLYFDSTLNRLEISQNAGTWEVLADTRTETMWIPTVTHPQVTATRGFAVANTAYCVRFYMVEDFLVERMAAEVAATSVGTFDVGFYDEATKALIVHTGALTGTSTGLKTATGLSGFLKKGTMYRFCSCGTATTGTLRSVSTTDVTFTLENAFVASPVEGTQTAACTSGVLPATLGTLTSATVIPPVIVIANSTDP
jgi:hypothetical protein